MDRLQQLIFSFYREDPGLEDRLEPLLSCRMRRSWGSIRIDCHDLDHLEEISGLLEYLRLPLAALGLGSQIEPVRVLRTPLCPGTSRRAVRRARE